MRRESSKNQFGRPKKKVDKISKNFLKSTSSLEKILDPPLFIIINYMFLIV